MNELVEDSALTVGDLQVLDQVDEVIARSLDEEDPRIAIRFGSALKRNMQVSGVALAKLLWNIQSNWKTFENSGIEDDFYSVIEAEMGLALITIKKYTRLWDSIFANPDIPAPIKQRLLGKPMTSLLLLPALTDEADVDWERVADAPTKDDLRSYVKEIRGATTSSESAVFITLDVRTGHLKAYMGGNSPVIFGLLNMDRMEEPAAKKAIERIIRNASIKEV